MLPSTKPSRLVKECCGLADPRAVVQTFLLDEDAVGGSFMPKSEAFNPVACV